MKVKLTAKSRATMQKELDKLHEKLAQNNMEMGRTIETDSRHENSWLEQLRYENQSLRARIRNLTLEINTAEFVMDVPQKGIVNIGDRVKLRLQYDNEDSDEEIFTLVDEYTSSHSLEENLVTLNSPIGLAIFHKSIGYHEKVSLADNGYLEVTILDIMDAE